MVGFGSLLFLSSVYLFATGFPLHELLFDVRFSQTGQPIGSLTQASGVIRRKSGSENAFNVIKGQQILYNYDTLVTNSDGNANIAFDDGTVLELSPNTMIQLVFAPKLSVEGISRLKTVNVIGG